MKIAEKIGKKIQFGELDCGDVFRIPGLKNIYMKVEKHTDRLTCLDFNAVNIDNGKFIFIQTNDEVCLVDGEFAEK